MYPNNRTGSDPGTGDDEPHTQKNVSTTRTVEQTETNVDGGAIADLLTAIKCHSDEVGAMLAEHCDQLVTREEHEAVKAENEDLRAENEALRERVETLEAESATVRETAEVERSVSDLADDVDRNTVSIGGLKNRGETLMDMLCELQGRELEKGAHLRETNVFPDDITVSAGQLEQITKDDGNQYYRLPGEEDALERGGAVAHATTDLLPLQRLARYDDDMLNSIANSQNDRLAAKAWRQRDEAGRYSLWSKGGTDVRVYLSSSDLTDWIMQKRSGISKKYAQELARRTMDAMLDLANGKLAKKTKTRRADGLTYKESRIVLFQDVDLPGEVGPAADTDPATSEGAGA